jgi:hypothetical protein
MHRKKFDRAVNDVTLALNHAHSTTRSWQQSRLLGLVRVYQDAQSIYLLVNNLYHCSTTGQLVHP